MYVATTAELSQNMSMPKPSNYPAIYPQQADILPSTYGIPLRGPGHLSRIRRTWDFKVASSHKSCGFSHVIPTRAVERQRSNRTAQVPLIAGHVFHQCSTSNRKTSLSTQRAYCVISFGAALPCESTRQQLMKNKLSFPATPIPS